MRSSIVAAAISLFMAGAAFGSEAHGASRKQMHIPAQQLGTALQILASDYDLQLIYVYEEVRDVHTGGAVGELGFDEALKSLLQGTGLTFRYLDEKTVTITPVNGKATGGYPSTPASQSRADVALVRTDYVVNVDAAEEPRKKMTLAQAATPAPAQTAPFEEVMVTARRRNEHVQDIPVAVTAISGEELTQRSVVVMHDVAAGVPNLTISTGQRSSMGINISLRGQSTTTPATNFDNAIGIYYDGVYLARTFATMATVMDIQSVEVDRGVQGTLSGRNTTGGAIRFETNKPQLGEYEAVVSGTAGNEGVYRGGAIVNIPLGDTLAMRFNYMVMSRDDLGRSVSTGAGFGNQNRQGWRGAIKWEPTADTSLLFEYEGLSAREHGNIAHPIVAPVVGGVQLRMPTNWYDTASAAAPRDDVDGSRYIFHFDQHFDDTSFKAIAAHDDHNVIVNIDSDGYALPAVDSLANFEDWSQDSVELQLNGRAFSNRLDWVFGLFWFKEQADMGNDLQVVPVSKTRTSAQNTSRAAFMHGEYSLTSQWLISAGLRYSQDDRYVNDKSVNGLGNCIIPLAVRNAAGATSCFVERDAKFHYPDFDISTTYKFTPEKMAYARIGRGHRSGGFTLGFRQLAHLRPFAEEQVTEGELGSKLQFWDGAFKLNTAVFYDDYQNIQRRIGRVLNGLPQLSTENAGKATVMGVELEASARLADHWDLHGSFGYTDASYDEFKSDQNNDGILDDVSSNDFINTPKLNYSIGLGFHQTVGALALESRLDYTWQDDVEFNTFNDVNRQKAYGLLNGRVTLSGDDRRWEVAIFGTNLTNQRYASFGITSEPYRIVYPGAPRLYGLDVRYRIL